MAAKASQASGIAANLENKSIMPDPYDIPVPKKRTRKRK
jgi:hypothetical protein